MDKVAVSNKPCELAVAKNKGPAEDKGLSLRVAVDNKCLAVDNKARLPTAVTNKGPAGGTSFDSFPRANVLMKIYKAK